MELKAKLEKTRDKIIQLKLILEEDSRAGRALSVNALKIDRLKIKVNYSFTLIILFI